MCSIIVTYNEAEPGNLKLMSEAIRHRGPDSFEVWNNQCYGIAACRLSIFGDPDSPMIYKDPSTGCIVLLNGEIYNFKELWSDLLTIGIQRKTNLESELIARLYEIHGPGFVRLLKGMFAIALLDGPQLVIARDRFGIKPLFYTKIGRKILISSEIKGILKHPEISPTLNMHAVEETSVFGYIVDQEATFFKNIYQVLPGTVVVFNRDNSVKKTQFARLPEIEYMKDGVEIDYEEAATLLKEYIIKSVERLFNHGNMEKGLYLSGGLDSSTIAFIAAKILGYQISTFTLADNINNPDLIAAKKVASALGTEHREYIVTAHDYWPALIDYIAHYECLMAGGVFDVQGGVAFHLLSQKVAKNVKVAFSGEGADELFGGYYWIYTHPLGFSERIRNNLKNILPNDRMQDIVNNLFPEPEDELTYRRNLFNFLIRGGLSNYHLQCVDRSSGALGFEIRPLYLYDDLSKYALDLPIEFKVSDKNTTKKILRDAFRKDFDLTGISWVNERKKLGMPFAISEIDKEITQKIDNTISDDEIINHPLGDILGSKMNVLLYDLFEHIFFKDWDHQDPCPPNNSLLARLWPIS